MTEQDEANTTAALGTERPRGGSNSEDEDDLVSREGSNKLGAPGSSLLIEEQREVERLKAEIIRI